ASAPWTPLVKPLAESRLALISSSGAYRRGQIPFKPDKNDLTFREIAVETAPFDLLISHDYYDHKDAEKDINCVFPLERLRELAAEGFIGSLTPFHLTFMGRIFRKTQFLDEMIPAMIARLKAMEADLVLLVPA
ncbi:MAG: glycine/betaine/sarcosine/D-proline family reductase selenoprotein B, partial [Deltaproteobacteria bacterium]|nr:glycine/betaine/sarcosine/D-proline family reductase selenoprotein B [Deltaproteobacteria bacterium]